MFMVCDAETDAGSVVYKQYLLYCKSVNMSRFDVKKFTKCKKMVVKLNKMKEN